jgi:dTDP-4-dehydrorhamnose reductase
MKVLITGSKGQLAHDVSNTFSFCECVGVDLPSYDLTDESVCVKLLDEVRPDVIINCAAFTNVDRCESDSTCWLVNSQISNYLSKWTEDRKKYLIHISTDYVFDGSKQLFTPLLETDVPNPVSEYGLSKLSGEKNIQNNTDRYSILRTSWLYGIHGHNFPKTILKSILNDPAKELKIVSDQYGTPTWSHTLARQIKIVFDNRESVSGIFHATSEGYCSWYEFASYFLKKMSLGHRIFECSSDEFKTVALRPRNSILENSRLKQHNINTFDDWRVDVDLFVKMYKNRLMSELICQD